MINEAKRLNCNDKITKSNNTIKTTWNIIRMQSGEQQMNTKIFKTGKINPNVFNNNFFSQLQKIFLLTFLLKLHLMLILIETINIT